MHTLRIYLSKFIFYTIKSIFSFRAKNETGLQRDHLVLFDYRKGRGKNEPMERLGSFEGTIQCDAYTVHKSIAQYSQRIRMTSFMAHTRRKFFDAMKHHPKAAEYTIVSQTKQ